MKVCTRCKISKPVTEFCKHALKTDGLRGWCRACERQSWTAYHKALKTNPEKLEKRRKQQNEFHKKRYPIMKDTISSQFRKRRYGISTEEMLILLEHQGGVCAACKGQATNFGKPGGGWHIDHNHRTNGIRSVLCAPCNRALGHAKEDPARLRALADYIERFYPTVLFMKPARYRKR